MGLETATHIHELVATNPVGAVDPKAQGDDHIRLLKATIQATFPDVEGVVTASHTELSLLDGITGFSGTGPSILRAIAPAMTGNATAENIDASGDLQIDSVSVLHMAQNDQTVSYALVAGDKGKVIDIDTSGVTVSLPNLAAGFTAVIMNSSSGSISIAATSGTLNYYHGTGSAPSTGTRTLARAGTCSVYKDAAGNWRIFGAGLS